MNTVKYGPEVANQVNKHDAQKRKDYNDQINLCLKLIDRASGLIATAHSELKALLKGV